MASLGDAGRWTIAALRRQVGRRAARVNPDRARSILEARVLVVDDEREIRDVLTDYLEGEGCAVTTAVNGHDALESVRRDPPDVILLDITLPGVDGLEVLRRVHRDHPEISILMLTRPGDAALARSALVSGATDYVGKPVTLAHLSHVVSAAVRRASELRD
jgi:DNA-binding response OmpR family regulator